MIVQTAPLLVVLALYTGTSVKGCTTASRTACTQSLIVQCGKFDSILRDLCEYCILVYYSHDCSKCHVPCVVRMC